MRSGFVLRDSEVERVLAAGEYQSILEDYFGPENYRELAALAREAERRSVRGGPRVLIVPGIMGSKLGRERTLLWDDLIWIDPVDVVAGKLEKLALGPGGAKIKPMGVMLLAYLKLKLRLKIAGFAADFHPFDWRQSIDKLGAELARRVANDKADKLDLVCHSMGGLVARAAVALGLPKLGRLVMLGTPNFGSFAPVQAIRASYPAVRAVAKLDQKNSPEELAEKVFTTLPGLHQMLPFKERYKRVDLYDRSVWPADAPRPRQAILDRCGAVQEALAPADPRFHLIAGVNQETTTDLVVENGKVEYETSRNGDGTVPLDFAELPGTATWYVEEKHGSLANNRVVGEAVIQILRTGDTSLLPRHWDRRAVRARRRVADEELRKREPFPGRSGADLGASERRELLADLASADSSEAAAISTAPGAPPAPAAATATAEPGWVHSIRDVEVGRREQHSIVLCLARGDITEVRARALVLGLFQGVAPSGAAGAIDERLDGAVKSFTERRMFSAEIGEIFALPTGRHLIYADTILFAGLGDHGTFGSEVQQFVAENVVRACIQTHIEDVASVLVGAASGASIETTVYNQLAGYFRGIEDADSDHRMRRITLCERDPEAYLRMKQEVYRLASTPLFKKIKVVFDETRLPEPPLLASAVRRGRISPEAQIAYLHVLEEERDRNASVIRASLLTPAGRASVLTSRREVQHKTLTALLDEIEGTGFTFAALDRFGGRLADLVLEPAVARVVGECARDGQHLVIVHDAPTSRIPWETLCIDKRFPAANGGVSRRYAAENLSVAKWSEQRRVGETLDILLVVNPTGDLPGAEREAKRIKEAFPQGESRVRLTEVAREEATRDRLLEEFQSGRYDVIHYAGHASFDERDRSRSGIDCADRVLTGYQLAGITNLPLLVVFNACESGRVRKGKDKKKKSLEMTARIDRNVGLAEAFLRGGAAQYVGTYWSVGDTAAAEFGHTFYTALAQGEAIGKAVQEGRKRIREAKSVDWADYVHYGSYDFRLKLRGG